MSKSLLIRNIGELVGIVPPGILRKCGAEMSSVESIRNAWLLVRDGRIAGFGEMPGIDREADEVLDAEGGMVMPAFCDSHTHIVYAGSREGEFLDKINGLSYEEIAARGGGILNSADLLHNTSEEELYRQAKARLDEMIAFGSGAVEVKSGYGLSTEDELKMLRVIRRLKESTPALVKATFLGAHAVPRGMTRSEYVDKICNEMLPAIATSEGLGVPARSCHPRLGGASLQGGGGPAGTPNPSDAPLADFVDVFCDEGFFTPEDTARILEAAAEYGIRPKIHANELAVSGGVQVGVRYNALSVDHLERATDAEIEVLKGTGTMPTMLPGSSFFLGLPYGRAKDFISAGLPLALASDYNPGSSPGGDMRFVMALGCIRMRLTPEQAFNACTLNSACAMGASEEVGSITIGKRANLILTEPGWNLTKIPYQYRTPFIRRIFLTS